MTTAEFFSSNRPQVISQTIDGEVVVINLKDGSYYSLTGSAACIWNAAEAGIASSKIPALLQARFTDCDAGLEKITSEFLAELVKESLLVPKENGCAMDSSSHPPASAAGEKFGRPVLKKFTDMQELLLLDPIHEVDATGWPQAGFISKHHADK